MTTPSASWIHALRPKIVERRLRLEAAARSAPADYVSGLLAEVDAALRSIDNGSYGLCETCHDPIEADRLERDPFTRFCLDHLTAPELLAHEQDLELATRIQAGLLPAKNLALNGWETHYCYRPAGAVGGDYCDVLAAPDGRSLFFAVGDVSGKGVAASLLMTHLSAILRSLLSLGLPLEEVLSRANRLFCQSTPSTHYATLAAGRASSGGVELCNAGHCRPLLLGPGGIRGVEASGLPLGLFCDARFAVTRIPVEPGETLVLYTDGIVEAQNPLGEAFEEERLVDSLRRLPALDPPAMIAAVLDDVARFRGSAAPHDDVTLLAICRRF